MSPTTPKPIAPLEQDVRSEFPYKHSTGETIGRFLGGGTVEDGTWSPRPVTIIDVPHDRDLDIEIIVPVEDMNEPGDPDPLDPAQTVTRSIWPASDRSRRTPCTT